MAGINPGVLLQPGKVAGVEAVLNSDGTARFHVAQCSRKGQGMDLGAVHTDLEGLSALVNVLKKGAAVSLVITGRGLILRTVEGGTDTSLEDVLQQVLPNARADEFYIQTYPQQNNKILAAVARKSAVDELRSALRQSGFIVPEVLLGPFAVLGTRSIASRKEGNTLLVGGHAFALDGDAVAEYAGPVDGGTVALDGMDVSEAAVTAFAAALHFFVPGAIQVFGAVDNLQTQKSELKQKQLFTIAGWSVLLTLLCVLLANFFLFDHYRKELADLSATVSLNEGNLEKIYALEAEVESKREFMAQTGILNPSRTSFMSDRIAQTVPSAIQLTELAIFPVEKRLKSDDEGIHFQPGIIHISGLSKRSTHVNNWIMQLEKFEWIREINVMNYTQENDREAGTFDLEILLAQAS